MNRASLPIRIRGWFFSMPKMIRCAAAAGGVFAIASNRSIDCARRALSVTPTPVRSEEHTSELQSPCNLVCRLLLEKKKKKHNTHDTLHTYVWAVTVV